MFLAVAFWLVLRLYGHLLGASLSVVDRRPDTFGRRNSLVQSFDLNFFHICETQRGQVLPACINS